jgi:hypothetical protein
MELAHIKFVVVGVEMILVALMNLNIDNWATFGR